MKLNIRRIIRFHKTLVVYSALLTVGLISLFVGLVPAISKSVILVKDLRTMREEIASIQKKASMLQSVDLLELEQTARDVLAGVPSDKSVSTLLSTIEAVATKYNLYISDMSIEGIASLAKDSGKPVTKPEGNSLTEGISLQGELIQLRNFLIECVRVRRLLRVKDMVITAMPKSNLITAKLTIEVFYLPLPQTIGKISDSLEPFSQKELATIEKIKSYPIMYDSEIMPISPQEIPTIGDIPTEPVVSDPFSAPSIETVLPTSSPTPSPLLSPTASPTATIKAPTPSPF
jgi:hypothetical protein